MPFIQAIPGGYRNRFVVEAASFLIFIASISIYSEHLGSPDLEPGLQGRNDIVFFEDFESADWKDHFSHVGKLENLTIVADPSFNSEKSLRVRLQKDGHYGTSVEFKYSKHGLPEPLEAYFRYYVYIPDNFEKMDKFPGFSGTYGVAGWGGRPSDGYNGWSARMKCKPADNGFMLHWYLYHADMPGKYGDNVAWDIGNVRIKRKQWHCIEAYAKMNTISGDKGNKDGILRGWVDGTLMCDKKDIRFRHVDKLKIEKIWFNIYYGGSWIAPHEMHVYWDNIVVAKNPIGQAKFTSMVMHAGDSESDRQFCPYAGRSQQFLYNMRGARIKNQFGNHVISIAVRNSPGGFEKIFVQTGK